MLIYSFIIPVYNRPEELDELLMSLSDQDYNHPFEVVVVEDGSTIRAEEVVEKYRSKLQISYYFKSNSGPGDSRNFGMNLARGDYFIILDSDCVLPNQYLNTVDSYLKSNFVDCFGGPDAAHHEFSVIQKAINYSMTSFLTTGGIRGSSEVIHRFQPRSFNMGLSKKAFLKTKGFDRIHPGEDPDLSIRLWQLGFSTALIKDAFVFHKRRIDWQKFFIQVNKFGKVRPILNQRYPEYAKYSFWFPTLFILGIDIAIILALFGTYSILICYTIYFLLVFFNATSRNKSLLIGSYGIWAVIVQFYGYGLGFLESMIKVRWCKKNPEEVFPELFFKDE